MASRTIPSLRFNDKNTVSDRANNFTFIKTPYLEYLDRLYFEFLYTRLYITILFDQATDRS